jgi:hypothetical protein
MTLIPTPATTLVSYSSNADAVTSYTSVAIRSDAPYILRISDMRVKKTGKDNCWANRSPARATTTGLAGHAPYPRSRWGDLPR